jgi:DNA (cytosine-5)-methyltransferase 1
MDLAGFDCAWQVEIDEHCRQILEEHWPGVPKYKDVYEVKGSEVEPVDILCGGFPCQPVSVAGKRGGVDDERWLWDEFYRLICELRPRWVVAENVTGLLSANSGRAFAGVLRDLAEGRYDAVWDVFPAGGPGGVGASHRRERIFIVAKLADTKRIRSQRPRKSVKSVNSKKKRNRKTVEFVNGSFQNQWTVEPNVGRVADGISNRVDRLKALGNAVVPQVAYKVARMIHEYTEKEK